MENITPAMMPNRAMSMTLITARAAYDRPNTPNTATQTIIHNGWNPLVVLMLSIVNPCPFTTLVATRK